MNNQQFGLGCGNLFMGTKKARCESRAIIKEALENNISFFNTADFYHSGESELALGSVITSEKRENIFISDKFGALVEPNGRMYGLDVHPDRVKNYLAYSLKRMNLDYIDLYQPGRIDQAIPVEETVGGIAELVQAGYVKKIGLTQVDATTLRKAHSVHPISYIEVEYSLFNRSMEEEILPVAKELGIKVIGFGLLAHGLLGGKWTKRSLEQGVSPQNNYIELFQKGNIEKNIELVENVKRIADAKNITLPQLVHAWAVSKSDIMFPVIGVSKVSQLQDSIQANKIHLTPKELKQIEAAVPVDKIAGNSFPNMQFRNGKVIKK
ncbi:aldo/keto reductase [Vagococcus entomophilus]|uniref:Aldo/keto reductase n=1 Tax=Vagococcus entomophilus TaxID=1160095 RepID=A0A430AFD0_9ENTE|nr:aldo/keto reductase [Vagococcus entomophilus]RSU06436.1 aldo/keto reductase [Vagococcus entomophilus]